MINCLQRPYNAMCNYLWGAAPAPVALPPVPAALAPLPAPMPALAPLPVFAPLPALAPMPAPVPVVAVPPLAPAPVAVGAGLRRRPGTRSLAEIDAALRAAQEDRIARAYRGLADRDRAILLGQRY